ncbi:MAG: hypothetical protein JRN20_15800 [Nitrososphaerota archaeon]|nr:hypothetical protein [Nitrososphaerota archaeon]MDG6923412.1 hypothetical protein [Nitrososphaerota archaeon]
MSHSHGKQLIPRHLKFPIFILGLFIMIGGSLVIERLGLPVEAVAGTAALGFVLFFLGIVLE